MDGEVPYLGPAPAGNRPAPSPARTDPVPHAPPSTLRPTPLRRTARLAAVLAVLVPLGCATARNYPDPAGPRYAGPLTEPPPPAEGPDTLLFVSFNVEYGKEPDSALAVLASTPELRGADVILLQEMDAPGTERIAEALGMAWVYYPAVERRSSGRDFGNAVLSRWPIVEDEKLVLPWLGVLNRSQRIATAVTVRVGRTPVRVYSVHLATPVNLAWQYRRDQWRAVLDDARRHPYAVLGGDLNSGSLGELAADLGFAWPTRDGPRTLLFGRWDHLFFRGLTAPDRGGAGTVLDNRGASDHLPVWAKAVLGG